MKSLMKADALDIYGLTELFSTYSENVPKRGECNTKFSATVIETREPEILLISYKPSTA